METGCARARHMEVEEALVRVAWRGCQGPTAMSTTPPPCVLVKQTEASAMQKRTVLTDSLVLQSGRVNSHSGLGYYATHKLKPRRISRDILYKTDSLPTMAALQSRRTRVVNGHQAISGLGQTTPTSTDSAAPAQIQQIFHRQLCAVRDWLARQ